ncbi:MAG: hypothetical protein HDR11_15810 [Lachnospiraceae bacterium]|nr:hypothetical protein [Lachnospiraceae bacterium]
MNTQNEFLSRYRERYNEEPKFDIAILKMMLEPKKRRVAEGEKTDVGKEKTMKNRKNSLNDYENAVAAAGTRYS